MKHYEKKLKELLGKTNSSFIIIRTPSFNYQVIYEEEISENFQDYLKFNDKGEDKIWINDGNIYVGKDFEDKDNPVTKKFYLLSKYNQGDLAKEVKMTPEDREIIEKRLNIPDFLDLENDKEVFWKNRYELKRDCTPNALTKILNAVNWNEKQNYDEFFKNILYDWKNIEMCDILYILSRKFSVNNYFRDDNKIKNFDGLKKLRKYAVHLLKNFSIKDLNFILLQLVQAIKYEDISNKSFYSPLVKLLFEKSKSDLIFASSFYWFIECESSDGELAPIFSKIKEFFLKEMEDNKLFINIIKNEIEFKSELEEISKIVKNTGTKDQKRKLLEIIDKEKKNFMHNEEHCLPIDPKIRIKGIFSQDCTVFGSAQRPIKYTFKMTPETKKNNRLGENIYYRLIYKSGDDLRQDQLILQMINFMDSLLKKYIDCEFTIYKVLATSKSDGFVEFVPESITYFDIIKKYKKLKFYFKDNIDNSVEYKNKLNKFVNSLAGYCAVNYILGIGDRHNQNIMFRKSGHLFHIDFGYIFGKEPNWLNPIRFKVSQDMIEFMGGKDSEMYKKFINKCVNAYLELRKNARTIINMFYLMIDSGIQQLKDIESLNKLHEQFAPGLTVDEAQEKFLKDYEDSLNSKTSEIREKFHEWKQDFL
jgi:phosphatidylinositol 3-kinase